MRRDYKYLYRPPAAPFVGTNAGYTDPVQTEAERRTLASLIAKRRAKLRRTKTAERWVVFTMTVLLAIAMWPLLLPVGVVLMTRALWRRYARVHLPRRPALATKQAGMPADSSRREESAQVQAEGVLAVSTGHACAA